MSYEVFDPPFEWYPASTEDWSSRQASEFHDWVMSSLHGRVLKLLVLLNLSSRDIIYNINAEHIGLASVGYREMHCEYAADLVGEDVEPLSQRVMQRLTVPGVSIAIDMGLMIALALMQTG